MLAVIDSRSSKEVKSNLQKYADDVLYFETSKITYNSISGHPDIFIFQSKERLIVAPNTPKLLFDFLLKHKINFHTGFQDVGDSLKNSVTYNCVATESLLLHKKGLTDLSILNAHSDKQFINLPQAYTRCSLMHLRNNIFITSDKGIENVLNHYNFKNCYFSPEHIRIFDHKNGFIGGTCGVCENKIFFNGNIKKHQDGNTLEMFLESLGYDIICLGNSQLYDGGGIIFINTGSICQTKN